MANSKGKLISIVVSVFNEDLNLKELDLQIAENLVNYNYELIYVNDGSTDNSLSVLKSIQHKNSRVRIVNLLKNFGHEIAMTAGMYYTKGDCVIFMDADLQHPPKLLPQLIEKWHEGFEIVSTRRIVNEGQSIFHQGVAKSYYYILNSLTDFKIPAQTPDFRLIDKKYIEVLKLFKEQKRMFRGLVSWLNIKNQITVDFEAPKRYAGKSKYGFRHLLGLSFDSIISFSIKPLRMAILIGLFAALISLILGVVFVYDFLTNPDYEFTGYGTTIVMVIFIGSVQLIFLGIIGEYIGRIHLEVKNRPLFVAELIERENDEP